jgi:YhcN/YlaJ family sporulation lipoprotein
MIKIALIKKGWNIMKNTVKSLGLILLTILLMTACNPTAQQDNQAQPYGYDQADPYYEGYTRDFPNDQATSYDQLFPYGQASTYDAVEPYERGHQIDRVDRGQGAYDDRTPRLNDRFNDEATTNGPNERVEPLAPDTPLTPRDGVIRPFDPDFPRQGRQNELNRQDRDQDTEDQGGITGLNEGTKAPQTPNRKNRDAQKVAQRLVSLATKVDNVNDATAIVAGRWAIVGIDVDAKLDRSRVGSIKYSVAEALKADPKGAYAVVTSDIDTNYRLRQMAQEIREGKPIAGVMDELAAIVGRLMPQIPRQVQDPDNVDENKTNIQGQNNKANKQPKNNTDKNS